MTAILALGNAMTDRFWRRFLLVGLMGLSACNQQTQDNTIDHQDDLTPMLGCFGVEKDEPALILISRQDGQFFMQMKEPTGAWDTAEPLMQADQVQAWAIFGQKNLAITATDIKAALVRPDGVMTLAMTKKGLSNINPNLESDFLMDILGASSFVYQVACDDVGVSFGEDKAIHGVQGE